jgi:inorganic pyrophosphatase
MDVPHEWAAPQCANAESIEDWPRITPAAIEAFFGRDKDPNEAKPAKINNRGGKEEAEAVLRRLFR